MKKSSNDRRRLVLNRDVLRTLATEELLAAAGGVSSEKSISQSGCPACGDPL
ncbi:MAG TPA: hypothetical protein VFK02_19840 [Kofleriaceae bacterium]|nr:hypothetical protein [Kofleriaceae bacterium]